MNTYAPRPIFDMRRTHFAKIALCGEALDIAASAGTAVHLGCWFPALAY